MNKIKSIKHIIAALMLMYTFFIFFIVFINLSFLIKQSGGQLLISMNSMFVWIGIFCGIPSLLVVYVFSTWLARIITQPLEYVQEMVSDFYKQKELSPLLQPNYSYKEAEKIKSRVSYILIDLKKELDILRVQSNIDPLTGIKNRRVVDVILEKWIKEYRQHSVIMLDLDHFKHVNDNYGHAVGDLVLKCLAEKMSEVTRINDINCRYGGEEFLILLPETSAGEAYLIAEKLRMMMAMTIISPCDHPITLSAGIATFPDTAVTVDGLLEHVDGALYKAKNDGRNCVKIS